MLRQRLQADQIQSLKSGDKIRLNILRYVLSQIKNKEIDKKAELDNEEATSILRKQVKELKEAIEHAQKANRPELVEENKKQLKIVSSYLPLELPNEDP